MFETRRHIVRKILRIIKMTIQATDVEQLEKPSAPVPAQEELPMQEQTAPLVAAPRGRGRPAGSKDKQPRKRPARAAWADVAGEEEEEETQEPPPRPSTRRRSSAPKSAPRRRVQIVTEESASSSSSAEEEEEEEAPPPSPRTTRHRQWAAYRQQKADVHQANVNRCAALFDRMFA